MNVKCPRCGSIKVRKILFGMPIGQLSKLIMNEKNIFVENEIIMDDMTQPDYRCEDCKFEWSLQRLKASDIVKLRFRKNIFCEKSTQRNKSIVYDIFPDGCIRIYEYEGKSRSASTKKVKHIDCEHVKEVAKRIQNDLSTPAVVDTNSQLSKCFKLQITYLDGRKIVVDSEKNQSRVFAVLEQFVNELM